MNRSILTIAGYDPSAASGILRDVATINEHRLYSSAVVTALTSQNSVSCSGVWPVSPEILKAQLSLLLGDYEYAAVKIGMTGSLENARVISKMLADLAVFVTIDPVFASSGGTALAGIELINFTKESLVTQTSIITPNVSEAEKLCGFPIADRLDLERAGAAISGMGARAVLVKGSHLKGDRVIDILFVGKTEHVFEHERIPGTDMRGTGCTLASALTANIVLGYDVIEASKRAIAYTEDAIRKAVRIGKGNPQTAPEFFNEDKSD